MDRLSGHTTAEVLHVDAFEDACSRGGARITRLQTRDKIICDPQFMCSGWRKICANATYIGGIAWINASDTENLVVLDLRDTLGTLDDDAIDGRCTDLGHILHDAILHLHISLICYANAVSGNAPVADIIWYCSRTNCIENAAAIGVDDVSKFREVAIPQKVDARIAIADLHFQK